MVVTMVPTKLKCPLIFAIILRNNYFENFSTTTSSNPLDLIPASTLTIVALMPELIGLNKKTTVLATSWVSRAFFLMVRDSAKR